MRAILVLTTTLFLSMTVSLLSVSHALSGGESAPSETCATSFGVSVLAAWIRPPAVPGHPAAGYLTLCNTGDRDDRLLLVESPDAARIEIHESRNEGGVMKMRRLEFVALAAGQVQDLSPGRRHLMIFGLSSDIGITDGDSHVLLRLRFEKAGVIEVRAPVGR